jgi:hypothetical protein
MGALLWRLAMVYEIYTNLIKLTTVTWFVYFVMATGGRVYCGSNCKRAGVEC